MGDFTCSTIDELAGEGNAGDTVVEGVMEAVGVLSMQVGGFCASTGPMVLAKTRMVGGALAKSTPTHPTAPGSLQRQDRGALSKAQLLGFVPQPNLVS